MKKCSNCTYLQNDDGAMGFSGVGYYCYQMKFNNINIVSHIKNGSDLHPVKNAFMDLNGIKDSFYCENYEKNK